jgi:hypothetical protein
VSPREVGRSEKSYTELCKIVRPTPDTGPVNSGNPLEGGIMLGTQPKLLSVHMEDGPNGIACRTTVSSANVEEASRFVDANVPGVKLHHY